jgi:hypothetical protein
VADKARIVEGDIFKEDFSGASVVTMYLLPHLNLCVRHRILAMEPGTRVVSHQYSMAEWDPDESAEIQGRDVFLWVVPTRVDGVWDFHDRQGTPFTIELRQTFGKIAGEITRGRVREPLLSATVRGHDLRFTFDTAGVTVEFAGTVHGSEIAGGLTTGTTGGTVEAVGRLRGALRDAPWAEMPVDCSRYYGREPGRSTRRGPRAPWPRARATAEAGLRRTSGVGHSARTRPKSLRIHTRIWAAIG